MENALPIEIILKQNENNFSLKERIIADYILNNINNIEKLNVKIILAECRVGSSSLYSFFNKINIKSIRDLWLMASQEAAVQKITEKDYFSLVQKVYLNVVEKNCQILNDKVLKQFISYIVKADLIYIAGVGASNLAAIELSRRLNRFGFKSFALDTETGEMISRASTISKKNLLISISMSGETKTVINTTKIAKNNHAKIIAITGESKTTLNSLADFKVTLFPTPFANNDSTLVSPLISYIFFIDSLISNMLTSDFDKYMAKRKATSSQIFKYTKKGE